MKQITAGWATDLEILRLSGSSIEEFDDHIVVKSPKNPSFHWGNFILVSQSGVVEDASRWVNTFEQNFPSANWVSIGLPTFPLSSGAWEKHGLELERMDVLKAETMPSVPDISAPYTSRVLQGSDWDLLLEREISENLKAGDHDPDSYEIFIRKAIENYKMLCEKGVAAWFGAFLEEELVADLGIVVCGKTARYQSVQTDENHRKKGLASHLLGEAATWAGERGCNSWVIVTESTNDAGRVYRRAGFKPDFETVTAYRVAK